MEKVFHWITSFLCISMAWLESNSWYLVEKRNTFILWNSMRPATNGGYIVYVCLCHYVKSVFKLRPYVFSLVFTSLKMAKWKEIP
jgi:hypothetical protein